jgi:hypothetical protein
VGGRVKVAMETKAPDWASLSVGERDRAAWEAIRSWPQAAGIDVVHDGIDFGHATRWFLWDKVGGAVRNAFHVDSNEQPSIRSSAAPPSNRLSEPVSTVKYRSHLSRAKLAVKRIAKKTPVLYCPFPYSRHAHILETIISNTRRYEIVVPDDFQATWPGTVGFKPSPIRDVTTERFYSELYSGMVEGLATHGVSFDEQTLLLLREELDLFANTIDAARRDLERLKPDAVLVPSDNTPPFSAVTHVARAMNIPVILLQHGMDCERYYLDDAYASHIATWGPYRRERYAHDSEWEPEQVRDVGNVHYDHVDASLLVQKAEPGHWVWVTRPHRPQKCYAPSRYPDEGHRILDALIKAMQVVPDCTLTIKPHPCDDADVYRDRLSERVRVSTDAVWPLMAQAELLITEDSTAGMDAMLLGKPLVHVHFAESAPVMPFVSFGAALPAFDEQDLVDAVRKAHCLSEDERSAMQSGQDAFLRHAVGERDGCASMRAARFVEDVLTQGRG